LQKAGLSSIEDIFDLELGYFFVSESFRGLGVSTAIARLLLIKKIDEDILATTELYASNPMTKTLEKLGFKHYGTIDVFLRFKKGVNNERTLSC
jgi:GNAT superfamily N-acetyltransferase